MLEGAAVSDLQCPARVVVVDSAAGSHPLSVQRPVAVWATPESRAAAGELARVLDIACRDLAGTPDSPARLVDALEDLADQYRGECVAVVVTATALADLVRLVLPGHAAGGVVVEIDADGQRWASLSDATGR